MKQPVGRPKKNPEDLVKMKYVAVRPDTHIMIRLEAIKANMKIVDYVQLVVDTYVRNKLEEELKNGSQRYI